jgi:hypothetical protein
MFIESYAIVIFVLEPNGIDGCLNAGMSIWMLWTSTDIEFLWA